MCMFALNLTCKNKLAPCIGYQIKSIGYIDDFLIRLIISVEVDSEHIMVAWGILSH